MDFQTRQTAARQSSGRLFLLLGLGVFAIVALLCLLAGLVAANVGTGGTRQAVTTTAVVAPLTLLGIGGASGVKSSQIRSGGGAHIASSLGGHPVDFNTHDPAERQLVNVVEEIAIASGMPVPTVFVLREERGINAFAAGWNGDNSVVGVTRGALEHLNRQELQGVIAHEFSHIANGDTRVKTRIIGWVFGIAALAVLGRIMLSVLDFGRLSRRSRESTAIIMAIAASGLVLMGIGFVGTWFARLVQAAVSRQREHLADASAVQYTREPQALASALLKIGGMGSDNHVHSAHIEEAGHLFFESPFRHSHATHPPLDKRIRALMPDWDGVYPRVTAIPEWADRAQESIADADGTLPGPRIPGLETGTPLDKVLGPIVIASGAGAAGSTDPVKDVASALQQPTFDAPTDAHIGYARTLLARIPSDIKDYLHTRQGAVAAVIGLLVSTDPAVRQAELDRAARMISLPADYLDQASQVISGLDRPLQLPAVDIALHSIRETPADYHVALVELIRELEAGSPDQDLFRWMLRRVVLRHLEDIDDHGRMRNNRSLDQLDDEAAAVYALVALGNSSGRSFADGVFRAAMDAAKLPPRPMPDEEFLSVERLDKALDDLSHMNRDSRLAFVQGALIAVRHDALTTADEAELVRVIADAVRLPMPPLLPAR